MFVSTNRMFLIILISHVLRRSFCQLITNDKHGSCHCSPHRPPDGVIYKFSVISRNGLLELDIFLFLLQYCLGDQPISCKQMCFYRTGMNLRSSQVTVISGHAMPTYKHVGVTHHQIHSSFVPLQLEHQEQFFDDLKIIAHSFAQRTRMFFDVLWILPFLTEAIYLSVFSHVTFFKITFATAWRAYLWIFSLVIIVFFGGITNRKVGSLRANDP